MPDWDRIHKIYPVMVLEDSIDQAVDKIMAADPGALADDETVREDIRIAFTEWLDQHIQDVLDDPIHHIHAAWSGFDHILNRVKTLHRRKVGEIEAVVVAKAGYDQAVKLYSALWEHRIDGGLPPVDPSVEEDAAYEFMVTARRAYLTEVQRALTSKTQDDESRGTVGT